MNTFHALKYLYLYRNKFGRCLKKSYLSGRCYLPRSKLPTFTVPDTSIVLSKIFNTFDTYDADKEDRKSSTGTAVNKINKKTDFPKTCVKLEV